MPARNLKKKAKKLKSSYVVQKKEVKEESDKEEGSDEEDDDDVKEEVEENVSDEEEDDGDEDEDMGGEGSDNDVEAKEEDDDQIEDEEEEFEHPEEKQRKSGVLYFPNLPPKFTPNRLRAYFEQKAPGMIGRVYCERNKRSKTIEDRFEEGWLEIKKKKLAKAIVNSFDNTPVGGKKADYVSHILWNIKYLSGFKWIHLTEQLQYEREIEKKRMAVEVSQARRVAGHFEEQVEKGKHLKKLEETTLKEGGKWEKFQRQINQRKTIDRQKKKNLQKANDDDVMKMIFAE